VRRRRRWRRRPSTPEWLPATYAISPPARKLRRPCRPPCVPATRCSWRVREVSAAMWSSIASCRTTA